MQVFGCLRMLDCFTVLGILVMQVFGLRCFNRFDQFVKVVGV